MKFAEQNKYVTEKTFPEQTHERKRIRREPAV